LIILLVTLFSPPCEACISLKDKLFYAIKENIELQQEVAYLTARLEKIVLSEKMIEENLSRVEESATKFTYKLGVDFERYEDKGKKSAPKFIPSSTYHEVEATIKFTKTHYPSNPNPSFNPKREVGKENPKLREKVFVCIFCGYADHLDEFYFRRKRIEKRRFQYARHSYRDEFIDFLSRSYSRVSLRSYSHALPRTSSHLCLSSLTDLTIAHMILVHERTILCLDALDMVHVLIVVIISREGLVFLLEGLTLTLNRDI
jgi:hypothetical protein